MSPHSFSQLPSPVADHFDINHDTDITTNMTQHLIYPPSTHHHIFAHHLNQHLNQHPHYISSQHNQNWSKPLVTISPSLSQPSVQQQYRQTSSSSPALSPPEPIYLKNQSNTSTTTDTNFNNGTVSSRHEGKDGKNSAYKRLARRVSQSSQKSIRISQSKSLTSPTTNVLPTKTTNTSMLRPIAPNPTPPKLCVSSQKEQEPEQEQKQKQKQQQKQQQSPTSSMTQKSNSDKTSSPLSSSPETITDMDSPSLSSSSCPTPKHACKICGKTFKRAHNLKIHGRLHNDDRPYGCPFDGCEKGFRWKSSIVSHINWHRTKRGQTLPLHSGTSTTATSRTNHTNQQQQQQQQQTTTSTSTVRKNGKKRKKNSESTWKTSSTPEQIQQDDHNAKHEITSKSSNKKVDIKHVKEKCKNYENGDVKYKVKGEDKKIVHDGDNIYDIEHKEQKNADENQVENKTSLSVKDMRIMIKREGHNDMSHGTERVGQPMPVLTPIGMDERIKKEKVIVENVTTSPQFYQKEHKGGHDDINKKKMKDEAVIINNNGKDGQAFGKIEKCEIDYDEKNDNECIVNFSDVSIGKEENHDAYRNGEVNLFEEFDEELIENRMEIDAGGLEMNMNGDISTTMMTTMMKTSMEVDEKKREIEERKEEDAKVMMKSKMEMDIETGLGIGNENNHDHWKNDDVGSPLSMLMMSDLPYDSFLSMKKHEDGEGSMDKENWDEKGNDMLQWFIDVEGVDLGEDVGLIESFDGDGWTESHSQP